MYVFCEFVLLPTNSSKSEDDTSDEEKQKEIDKKKDEEAKAKLKVEAKPSGTSSKGNTTPSGRPKHTDPMKKSKSLKRPGSPDSDTSGNESSRKKHKKKHASSSQPTGTSTPIPGSRSMSPASSSQPHPGQPQRKSSIVKMTGLNPSELSRISSTAPNPQGATSDGEATGGEMSDGGKKKKITLRIGGSPTVSRGASPAPGRSGDSRAGSPARGPGMPFPLD